MEFLGWSETMCDKGKVRLEMGTDSGVVSRVRDQILTCEETRRVGARQVCFQVAVGDLAAGSRQA